MEEIQSLAKRIETDHDDLDAWQRLGELVDDPQKKYDCRDQVTRIQNERLGVFYPIPCKQCGALMQVAPAGEGRPATAVCPACCQTMELVVTGKPAAGTARIDPPRTKSSTKIVGPKNRLTLIAIIASNLLPAFGVLLLGWSTASVMVLYWLENIIVGFFAALKMAFARGGVGGSSRRQGYIKASRSSPIGSGLVKLMYISFLCVHFGVFCAVHGAFVLALFLPRDLTTDQWPDLLAGLTVPILGLLVSHALYFFRTYLGGGIFRYATISDLMIEPYNRMIPLHFGLILAGFFVVAVGSPTAVVLLLVLLKTGAEVVAYRKSLKRWRRGAA